MRRFRNHGWVYYQRLCDILPSGGARGTHAYHPSIATPQTTNVDRDSEPEDTPMADVPTSTSNIPLQASQPTTRIMTSTSSPIHSRLDKRPLDNTPRQSSESTHYSESILSPEIFASTSGTVSTTHSSKKRKTDSLVSTHSKLANLTQATKLTPAVAIMGMQGSINHLTDILQQSLVTVEDKEAVGSQTVMKILQEDDADLPMPTKVALMRIFADPTFSAATDVYSQTTDKEMRRAFIESLLDQ